jgi:transposase
MAFEEITALLGGWPGFELIGVERVPAREGQAPTVELTLRARAGETKHCGRCGAAVAEVHDVTQRRIRDLPILDADTWLIVPWARVRCPQCGPTAEQVPWLDRYQRMTTRCAEWIAGWAQLLPLEHVSRQCHVHWTTVKQIDQRALTRRLGPPDLRGVRVLAVDEFALRRGHRYATIVVEVPTKRVLWISHERDQRALDSFFAALGPAGCAAIEAVVMDMWMPYRSAVRAHCPQAAIVYDLFHVLAAYQRDVLQKVRVAEANRLHPVRAQNARVEGIRRVVKGTKWLLLTKRSRLSRPAYVRLRDLLAMNRALFIAYVLKEDLQRLWRYHYPAAARRAWAHWYRRAMASRLPPLINFARRLARWHPCIINHCRYPLHTGLLEGMNNRIKVLKRMAYGYRDDGYFFLKIRAAFPGNPR